METKRDSRDDVLRCSFCNRSQREVKKLIAGPTVFICDECVNICLDIIAEDRILDVREELLPVDQIKAELDISIVGQASVKHALAAVLRNHLIKVHGDHASHFKKSNVLILGPSGTGKTLMVTCLERILNVPVVIIDAPRLMGGYFKEENVLEVLYRRAGDRLERNGGGVICIDQLDRIACRGGVEEPGRRIQESLLEVLEGTRLTVALERSKISVDTSNILFIGCGSISSESGSPPARHRREELIRSGFLPAFVDRFGVILELSRLSETELVELLTRPGGFLEEYRRLFQFDRIALAFDPDAIETIAKEARLRGGGARSLRAVLESIALEVSLECSSRPRPLELSIDGAFVSRCL